MLLTQVTAPTAEPVSLETVKAFLRVEHTHEDALIPIFIRAARSACEQAARVSFMRATWEAVYQLPRYLPGPFGIGGRTDDPDGINSGLTLRNGPVTSLDAIKLRGSGEEVTLGTAHFIRNGGRFTWANSFREVLSGREQLIVRYTSGAESADDLAARFPDLQLALLMTVGVIYENRGLSDVVIPPGAQRLLNSAFTFTG